MASGVPISLDTPTSGLLETDPVVLELTSSGSIMIDGALMEGEHDDFTLVVRELYASIHQLHLQDETESELAEYCLVEVPALKSV